MLAGKTAGFEFLDGGAVDFLTAYLEQQVPSGKEGSGQALWRERMALYTDQVMEQPYGSVVAVIKPKAKFKVVLAAHADEIGWMVSYIMDDGYIRVEGTGDPATALGRAVVIHGVEGPVDAIVGWPAIHMREEKKEAKTEDLFLDCGCRSREEVESLGIRVGSTAVYRSALVLMNRKSIVARALDNRIGGFMLTEVARALHAHKVELPFGLYFVNAVQEEIGTKGARMMVEALRPDLVVVTDVTHDTTMPGVSKAKYGDIWIEKGPVLSFGPSVHSALVEIVEEVARKEGIPYQRAAAMKSTGTDADAFAYGHGGTRSVLVSIPIKYMHTPVEYADRGTVADTCRLLLATLQELATRVAILEQEAKAGDIRRLGESN